MFSTLDGQILDWILLPDEEATHQQAEPEEILKFILFEESTYSIQLAIRRLEAEVRFCGLVYYTAYVIIKGTLSWPYHDFGQAIACGWGSVGYLMTLFFRVSKVILFWLLVSVLALPRSRPVWSTRHGR